MVLVTFVETKVTRPSGRNRHQPHRECCGCHTTQHAGGSSPGRSVL